MCWSNSPQLALQLDSPVDFSSDGPTICPRLVIVPSVLTPADASWTPCCWGLHSEASFVSPDWFCSGAVPHLASQWMRILFFTCVYCTYISTVTWTDAMKGHTQVELWCAEFNLFFLLNLLLITLCGQSSELELLSCVLANFLRSFFSCSPGKGGAGLQYWRNRVLQY